jgi:two-component system response regulator AtoC
MKHKILIIDDCELDLQGLELLLEGQDFQVRATTDSDEGIAFVRQNRGAISLAIVDYHMPGQSGAKVAEALSALDPDLQIATYSGDTSADALGNTLSAGSQYFIPKGMEADKLLAIVKMFCSRFEEANKTKKIEPVTAADIAKINTIGITGCSRHLVEVVDLISKYAPQDETVLITGENGTGKEKVARALHNLSGRRGPFIAVNCGALPMDLLESELFGHEKGAFSGALRTKVGLVNAANNGTIFLDEIGDLALLLQVKLLRFLQEGEVRPVGSNHSEKVNTRVIAATNINLDEAVPAGRFRQDLFYRIKGTPINLLPLRRRPEDIKPLVHRFSHHSFASHFVMNGGSLYDLQKLLGHARFEETQRYAHLTPEHLAKAVNIVSFGGTPPLAPTEKPAPALQPVAEQSVTRPALRLVSPS